MALDEKLDNRNGEIGDSKIEGGNLENRAPGLFGFNLQSAMAPRSLATQLPGADQLAVFLFAPAVEQHPDRVNAERRPQRKAGEGNEAQDDGQHARPGLSIHQSPSRGNSGQGLDQQDDAHGGENRLHDSRNLV
jgi:hypothetical protein